MLDDIQDSSDLRRGKPAAHKVFGVPQTINSAYLGMIHAIQAAQELQHPEAVRIVLEEIENLHIGQGHDLHWTRHASCPMEDEYLEMVSLKTGGLFRLPCRLMMLLTPNQSEVKDELESLITLIGQTFQIRDDYQNLASAEYTSQKGFCDDLDEGKFSFPLIHCLSSARSEVMEVIEMMRARVESGGVMHEMKSSLLERMREAGSLEYTKCVLAGMKEQTEESIGRVERAMQEENWVLRSFVEKLAV